MIKIISVVKKSSIDLVVLSEQTGMGLPIHNSYRWTLSLLCPLNCVSFQFMYVTETARRFAYGI